MVLTVPTMKHRFNFNRKTIAYLLLYSLIGCFGLFFIINNLFSHSTIHIHCNCNSTPHENQPPVNRLRISENFNLASVEDNLHSLDQKDPQLIQYTRVRHLTPPSKQPYNLGNTKRIHPDGFSGFIAKLFNNKRNGVFIEAGANDGVRASHTLYLEKELGWSGLLVECNPTVVPYLKTKHRKAWIAGVCLSPSSHAETFNFSNPTSWSLSGTLGKPWNLRLGSEGAWGRSIPTNWTFFDVQAIPLYTILAGLGWKEVDYFSFDVEGQELAILRDFPFDLFRFKVIIYEEQFTSDEERSELDTLLKKNGYVFLKKMEVDKVYVHGEFYNEMGSEAMKAAAA